MSKRALWIILAAGLGVRAGLAAVAWSEPSRFLTPDSRDYDALARQLLRHGQFARSSDGTAEMFRTPGYPLLLAGVYALTGSSLRAVVAVQILLDVGLCWLVYRLGRELLGRAAGLVACALQAATTVAVASGLRVLTDGPFAFLLTAGVLLLVRYFKVRQWALLAAAAIVLGATAYVRPVGLYLAGLVLLVLLFRLRTLRGALLFACLFAGCVAPWVVRNYLAADYPGFSTLSSEALFKYQGPYVLAKVGGISVDQAREQLNGRLEEYAAREHPSRGRLEGKRAALGMEVLRAHPWTYLGMHLRGCLMVWAPGEGDVLELAGLPAGEKGTLEVLSQQGLWGAVRHFCQQRGWMLWVYVPAALVLAAKYLLALAGAWRRLRLKMPPAGWLLLGTVVLLAVLPGPFGHPRFRVPIAPVLNLAAAGALVALAGRVRRRLRPVPQPGPIAPAGRE